MKILVSEYKIAATIFYDTNILKTTFGMSWKNNYLVSYLLKKNYSEYPQMSLHDWTILRQLSPDFLTTVRIAYVFGQTGNEALLITGDDKVYGVGKNISDCLGLADIPITNNFLPVFNPNLSDKNLKGFTCGGNANNRIFVVAHSQNGEIYQWGLAPRKSYYEINVVPQRVELDLKVKVKEVACGTSHCMVLSTDGKVFTWGDNDEGQLGHYEQSTYDDYSKSIGTSTPCRVKGMIDEKFVTDISCGGKFSVVLLDGGEVFSWGCNKNGQLGINNKDSSAIVPIAVSSLKNVVISKIACGATHVLALSKKHELYVWGNNSVSQLGFPNTKKIYGRPVECAKNLRFVEVSASYACDLSVAQCEGGEVYMWGKTSTGNIITQPTDSHCVSIHQVFAFHSTPNMMPKPMRHILEAKRRKTMLKTLENEFGNPENADLVIIVGNSKIHVHQAILKMRSLYFRTMLTRWMKKDEKVVTVIEKSYCAVEAYLKYLYTDKLDVNLELAVELLQLADEYGDDEFKLLCEQSIKRDLTADKVADLFAFTRKLGFCQGLNSFCLEYALNHAEKVINSEGFKMWDLDTMTAFTVEYVKMKKLCNPGYSS